MRSLCIFALLTLTGCAHTFSVSMGAQPPDAAHYVIVQTNRTGAMHVYDCRSEPDGKHWQPTCVRADMRDSPPGTN